MDKITHEEARHISRLTHLDSGAHIDTAGKPVSEVIDWLRSFSGDPPFRIDFDAEMDIIEI
jgi:hypothetical protein